MKGALLVAGTSSDAGKSMIAAGLCRWLARQGVPVAPVKAQNMSLNSFVITDGAQIGRAQAMQAAAAGIEPQARMNPVLLKTGSDWRSQVVLPARFPLPASHFAHAGQRRNAAVFCHPANPSGSHTMARPCELAHNPLRSKQQARLLRGGYIVHVAPVCQWPSPFGRPPAPGHGM